MRPRLYMNAEETQLKPEAWSGYGGVGSIGSQCRVADGVVVAVVVALVDGGDRTPEVPVRLLAPAGDDGVGADQVGHGEQSRFVGDAQTFRLGDGAQRPVEQLGGMDVVEVGDGLLLGRARGCSMPPRSLTSLYSVVYSALSSGFGPAVRNCDELSIRNGSTLATQANGSLISSGGAGRHSPG